jgi:hypothetical protein
MLLQKSKENNWATDYSAADKFELYVVAEFPLNTINTDCLQRNITSSLIPKKNLDLIPKYKFTNLYVTIPERFKSSPLNSIYKNLADSKNRIDPSSCFKNFLDFDAF